MKPLSQSEFNLAVRAKNGDASANLELWQRYKPVAISILKPVRGWSFEEKTSEAYMIFLHKLEIFNPDKVLTARNPDTFTFSYMMTGGLKNLKAKLISEYKNRSSHISFMPLEEDTTGSHGLDKEYPFIVIEKGNFYLAKNKINIAVFDSNNPANIVIKDTENELLKKERLFYTKLSDLQKQVLEMRREGKTYKEIGNIFGCSDSRIKRHCADAKNIAAKIFGLKLDLRGS